MKTVLNKYQLLEEIGSGSFSKIYKVKDTYTNNCYAMKIEKKPTRVEATDADQPSTFSLIVREANLHSRLFDLECIPKMRWFGQDQLCYYMVLPLLTGTFSNVVFQLDCPTQYAAWVEVAHQMLHAVQALHEHGYLHRDIKPDNFMFDQEGKIFLIDLGLCKKYLTPTGQHVPYKRRSAETILGTANYISVNVHHGHEPSRRDDVESICYVLWKIGGGLDWGTHSDEDWATICEKKTALLHHPGIPAALLRLLQRTRNLHYFDTPCYDM